MRNSIYLYTAYSIIFMNSDGGNLFQNDYFYTILWMDGLIGEIESRIYVNLR
jgi:hypothetical protein